MLATAWKNSFIAEIRTFKQLSEAGSIESNTSVKLHVQIEEEFIDNKDAYSAIRRDLQITATFLRSEAVGLHQDDIIIVSDSKYRLQAELSRDEISITYIVLLL